MKFKAKYLGTDNCYGNIKQVDVVEVKIASFEMRDDTGLAHFPPVCDLEIITEDEEPKDKAQGLRDLIGQDMKSLNLEFK